MGDAIIMALRRRVTGDDYGHALIYLLEYWRRHDTLAIASRGWSAAHERAGLCRRDDDYREKGRDMTRH